MSVDIQRRLMGYRIRNLIEVGHNNPARCGNVRGHQEVVIKLGPEVGEEVIIVAAIRDPEGGHVGDAEVVGDHHHQDVPPHRPRHLLGAQPGLRGHVEVVSRPAAPALVILDLKPGVQQPPLEAVVLPVGVFMETVPALDDATSRQLVTPGTHLALL